MLFLSVSSETCFLVVVTAFRVSLQPFSDLICRSEYFTHQHVLSSERLNILLSVILETAPLNWVQTSFEEYLVPHAPLDSASHGSLTKANMESKMYSWISPYYTISARSELPCWLRDQREPQQQFSINEGVVGSAHEFLLEGIHVIWDILCNFDY